LHSRFDLLEMALVRMPKGQPRGHHAADPLWTK
jgi:hypothetical protein